MFPLFSAAEHFLSVEPKWYLSAFWKTSGENKAGKRCTSKILRIFALRNCCTPLHLEKDLTLCLYTRNRHFCHLHENHPKDNQVYALLNSSFSVLYT